MSDLERGKGRRQKEAKTITYVDIHRGCMDVLTALRGYLHAENA